VLLGLMGADITPPTRFPVTAGFDFKKKTGRREYVRVSLEAGADGQLIARKAGRDGAGVLSSLVAADGLLELHEDASGLAKGETAAYLPFSEVMR